MKDNQKKELLRQLDNMEKRINDMRETIASYAKDEYFTLSTCDAIAGYATTLAGNVQERRSFCLALSILGYRVEWKDGHAVDITEVDA